MKKLTSAQKQKLFIAACGRAVRELAIENSNGYRAVNKIHRSKKTYTRKTKHKSKFER